MDGPELRNAPVLALHAAVALREHRKRLRRDRVPEPPGLAAIEALCTQLAGTSRHEPQAFGADAEPGEAGVMNHDPLLLLHKEAAAMLRMSERTLNRLVHEGKIHPVDAGRGRTMFRRADIEQYVASLGPRSMREQVTLKGSGEWKPAACSAAGVG
jgi:excisionase family DNA binding protein